MTSSLLAPSLLEADPLLRTTELYLTSWLVHPSIGEMIEPGVYLVPHRQWISASELDRYHDLPPVEVEITPRRPLPSSWKEQAACHGMDLTLFFGDEGAARPAMRRSVLRRAKEVCDECPVVRECLANALENDERGVWGGTSRRQRKVWLVQISKGERTIEEVVDECHPIHQSSPPDSSLSAVAS